MGIRNRAETGYTIIEPHDDIGIRVYALILITETLVNDHHANTGSMALSAAYDTPWTIPVLYKNKVQSISNSTLGGL